MIDQLISFQISRSFDRAENSTFRTQVYEETDIDLFANSAQSGSRQQQPRRRYATKLLRKSFVGSYFMIWQPLCILSASAIIGERLIKKILLATAAKKHLQIRRANFFSLLRPVDTALNPITTHVSSFLIHSGIRDHRKYNQRNDIR